MLKNLPLNIDDDVSKAVEKIKKTKADDITLVFPKGSWLLSSQVNLKLLKKQTDLLGKKIGITTRDEAGRKHAQDAGFEFREIDYITRRKSMDSGVPKRAAFERHKVAERPEHILEKVPEDQHQPIVEQFDSGKFEPWAEELLSEPGIEQQEIGREPQAEKSIFLDAEQLRPRRRRAKYIWRTVIAAALIFVLAMLIILPSAKITVFAKTQPITRDFQVTVDKAATAPDQDQMIIPGKAVEDRASFDVQFSGTGQLNVGNAARGTVQIYNFTGRILRLGADTTTLSVGSKQYHFVSDISNIKPSRYFPGTKDADPASLGPQIEIIANAPGEDSNFPGGTRVEIHNKILGSLPTALYAKANDAIDGGTTRLRTLVTQQDLDDAARNISQKILQQESDKFAQQGLKILSSASNLQVTGLTFDKKAGDQAEKFDGAGEFSFSALAFSADQVRNMVEQRITLTLDQGKYLVTDSNEQVTEDFKNIDLNSGTGVLTVHLVSTVASHIDTAGIAGQVNGKTVPELQEMLLSNPNVDSVDIRFMPFWVKSVPKFSWRVKVDSKLKQ